MRALIMIFSVFFLSRKRSCFLSDVGQCTCPLVGVYKKAFKGISRFGVREENYLGIF